MTGNTDVDYRGPNGVKGHFLINTQATFSDPQLRTGGGKMGEDQA